MLDMHSVLHLMHLGLAVLSGSAASQRRRRERKRERDHMKIGPCALCVLGVTFDVSLAVLSGSVASVWRRERERLFT